MIEDAALDARRVSAVEAALVPLQPPQEPKGSVEDADLAGGQR